MRRTTVLVLSIAAGLVVVGGAATAITIAAMSSPAPAITAAAPVEEVLVETTPTPTPEPAVDATTASLLFMIEEEKLAHDVYVTLGDLWGANIFTNISQSETTHQEQVLVLLDARAITDPRSSEIGVFVNPDLQALYDQLIDQGSVSQADAMQVGIAIETKDIADLAVAMAAEDESDVITVYERLLSGSENHLAAFTRQA